MINGPSDVASRGVRAAPAVYKRSAEVTTTHTPAARWAALDRLLARYPGLAARCDRALVDAVGDPFLHANGAWPERYFLVRARVHSTVLNRPLRSGRAAWSTRRRPARRTSSRTCRTSRPRAWLEGLLRASSSARERERGQGGASHPCRVRAEARR